MAYMILLDGVMTYDNGCLELDGEPLPPTIMDWLPAASESLDGTPSFGAVRIEIVFEDYDRCEHCGSIVRGEAR